MGCSVYEKHEFLPFVELYFSQRKLQPHHIPDPPVFYSSDSSLIKYLGAYGVSICRLDIHYCHEVLLRTSTDYPMEADTEFLFMWIHLDTHQPKLRIMDCPSNFPGAYFLPLYQLPQSYLQY